MPVARLRFDLLRLSLLASLVLVALCAPLGAQTVDNPRMVEFDPSADHDVVLTDGSPAVSSYELQFYQVGAGQPFQTLDLGKPAPDADGKIRYDLTSVLAAWPLSGTVYEARVDAVGPAGSGLSDPSNPFTVSGGCGVALSPTAASFPAAGGGGDISVTTAAGCSWTAQPGAAWLTMLVGSGTGSGTASYDVAANTATTSRTGTLSIGGTTVTVTQGGASQSAPTAPASPAPATGATGVTTAPTLAWTSSGATSYVVRFGTTNPPPQVATGLTTASYKPATLAAGTRCYWQVVATNASGSTTGAVWSFTTAASAPTAPASPSPASGATGVTTAPTLTWTSSGATSYTVRFGTTNPPPQVATGLTSASYKPATLAAGTGYYWQVVATNASGSTTGAVWSFTTAASAPTAPGIPSPWVNQDIGAVGQAGSASYASGVFTVKGAGSDIWGAADSFNYTSQPWSGDGQIVARVTGLTNTNSYAKAGVMLRESTAPGSAHVILDVRPGGGVEFMKRAATNGSTTYLGGTTQARPAWLRLARSGSTVTASVSADGVNWRTVGSTTVSMATTASLGLAVTSHNTAATTTATFDNVSASAVSSASVVSPLPSPWQSSDVGSTGTAGSASVSGTTFTVKGSGSDIWGSSDAFQFVNHAVTGDVTLVARVTSLTNTNIYAKAGLDLRETLAAGSAHVILDVRPGGGVEFMKRSATGGSTAYLSGATQAMPAWLKLTRVGATVTGYVSADGVNWNTVGTTTTSMASSAYVGLAVTSHASGLATATFDNVK